VRGARQQHTGFYRYQRRERQRHAPCGNRRLRGWRPRIYTDRDVEDFEFKRGGGPGASDEVLAGVLLNFRLTTMLTKGCVKVSRPHLLPLFLALVHLDLSRNQIETDGLVY
jgi:hypothetical protein